MACSGRLAARLASELKIKGSNPGQEGLDLSPGLECIHVSTQLSWVSDFSLGKVKAAVHSADHTITSLATETGERCFVSPIDQLGLTLLLLYLFDQK